MTADVTELRGLTVARGVERVRSGEPRPTAVDAYASADDGFLGPSCGGRSRAGVGTGEGALAGAPIAIKDIFCTEDIPTTAGLESSRATGPRSRRPRCRSSPVPARASWARRTWTSSRWDRRTRTRRTARFRTPGRPGVCRAARRAAPRQRLPAASRPRSWNRHRRLDSPAGLALRDRRAEANLRLDLPLGNDRVRLLARPVRAADPGRHRRGAPHERHAGTRSVRLDLGRTGGRGRAAKPDGPQRPAVRGAADFSADAEGVEPGVRRSSTGRWR